VPILTGAAVLNGDPVRWVCFVVDLSARRAQEAVRQASMAEAQHDLRNTLGVARWQVQMLRTLLEGAPLDDKSLRQAVEVIEDATVRMNATIDDLMGVVLLRVGQAADLKLGPTDLLAAAERAAERCRRTTDRHAVIVQTAEPALVGTWDGAKLDRVLDNLLGNAVKYSPHGRTVAVSVARERAADGDWAVLAVRDEGIGIPDVDLAIVFDPYTRGSNVVGGSRGSGLGLAGAKRIVEAHGGTIEVESREGHGSTFTVRLPLAGPRAGDRSLTENDAGTR
jgi:signal transduction histidine kinase